MSATVHGDFNILEVKADDDELIHVAKGVTCESLIDLEAPMSNSKHTPAPWGVFEHSWSDSSIHNSDKSKIIARLSIYEDANEENQSELEKEMDANARLISASPDLLEALENLLETCDYGDSNHEEYNAAVAAISKAKGESV